MTTTVDITQAARDWVANYEMLRSFSASTWPAAILAQKDRAIQAFAAVDFPSTRHEEWKYTRLRAMVDAGYSPAFHPAQTSIDPVSGSFYDAVLPPGLGGNVVVLVNGHYDPQLSRVQAGSIQVSSLKAAIEGGNPLVLEHFGRIADPEGRALVALNTAIATDGAFLHIPKKFQSQAPVLILHLGYGGQVASQGRTLIVAEETSDVKVIEIWHQWGSGAAWENHVSEILVGEGACLELATVQNKLGEGYSLTHFNQVVQGKGSTFRSTVMTAEGRLVRNDLQVRHMGTGCTTYLGGLTLLDGTSHVDHHTLVDHAMPHCYSNENYKTVLDGSSTSVFNGKVIVRPDAQKTNAFQSNKTLLLSEGATVNAKPQLEIFADDVKCSHGATTGRLDETALFYLRSRGLGENVARALLTYAFGAAILEDISIPELRDHLEGYLMERLTGR